MAKIFRGNQFVEAFVCDGKSYTKAQLIRYKAKKLVQRLLKTSAVTVSVAWVAVLSMLGGRALFPQTVFAERTTVKEVKAHAPVMDKILKCESGGTHIDPKTGQVLQRVNTNGTIDTGKYQINSVHAKQATKLGLNLTDEKDNEAFAYYLYENFGTEPWYSSEKCWNK